MKVSVIVPNYNHSKFLTQRIDSILLQTWHDFELIIIDDCSVDDSRGVIGQYCDNAHVSHIVFNEVNSGSPFLQWEKGLALAKGEYVWIAESDDYAHPDFLATCVEQLERHPEAVLCHTGSVFVNANGVPIDKSYDPWPEDGKARVYASERYLRHNMTFADECYNASKVVFRRNAYDKIAKTFATFRFAGDWLFMASLIMQGKVVVVHRKLNYYRWHGANVTSQSEKNTAWLYEKIRLYAELLRLVPTGRYNRWMVCGLVLKYIKRQDASPAERERLYDLAASELGACRWHYIAERVNKTLSNIIPFLPEGKGYVLK